MMNGFYGMNMGSFGIFAWITWILLITALVLGNIWLWQKINKKK